MAATQFGSASFLACFYMRTTRGATRRDNSVASRGDYIMTTSTAIGIKFYQYMRSYNTGSV